MFTKVITFRQVFFTMSLLLIANMLVNIFTASTKPAEVKTEHTHTPGTWCDYEGKECPIYDPRYDYSITGAYQIRLEHNGDALIYSGDRYVGVLPYNAKCDFHKLIYKDNE